MIESPQQYFLTRASKQLDLVGPTSYDKTMSDIYRTLNHLTKDPTNLWDCLDLVRHIAFYTGGLWRNSPTGGVPDLVAPPDTTPTSQGVEYDKRVLQILIDRCARLPRQDNTNLAAADYETHGWDYDTLDYVPATTNESLAEAIHVYYWALAYETEHESILELLNILLRDAWELYLRAWEHTNA